MPVGSPYLEATFRQLPTFGTPDFTLPAALKTIEKSAFEGLTQLRIVDAGSVSAIGK